MEESMLTTIDNPYDPFEEFDDWRSYDEREGHYTLAYLARIAATSDEMSKADFNLVLENAIDEIIEYNLTGMYKKVTREVDEDENPLQL